MLHNEAYSQLPEYAAGALTESERQAVDAHLSSGCVECLAELERLQSATHSLIAFDGVEPPPAGTKARLLERIDNTAAETEAAQRSLAKPAWARPWVQFALAASLLAAVGLSILAWFADPPPGNGMVDGGGRATAQPRVRFVDFALGGRLPKFLKHAIYDEQSQEMHVWVQPAEGPADATPQFVRVVDANDRVLATSSLESMEGVAGAVISVPQLSSDGKLVVLAAAEAGGEEVVLESLPFRLR